MERNVATLFNAIENTYFPHLVQDYAEGRETDDIKRKMTRDFAEGLHYKKGSKYIKIISSRDGGNRTVHSFIVLTPTKGFEIGDILKPAGWAAPATNFKRGNVFEPETFASIRWVGP